MYSTNYHFRKLKYTSVTFLTFGLAQLCLDAPMMTKEMEKYKDLHHQPPASMFSETIVSFAMISSALVMLEVLL